MKRYLILIALSIVPYVSMAQWHYTVSLTTSGCGYLDKTVAESQVNYWMGEGYRTFSNKNECEKSRTFVMSQSYTDGNCRVRYIASPCTGPAGTTGNANVLNSNNGSSYYSTNPANEINDWSNDYIERMLTFNANQILEQEQFVPIADSEYKSALVELNGKTYFRSLNIDEQGGMLTSSLDLDSFEPVWQMEKNGRNLPDVDVYAYKDRITNEAEDVLSELLKKTDMSREELENKIPEWNYILNHFALKESANYKEEKDILEKVYALAKYKVDYKAILNLKYIDGADEDKQTTEAAFLIANGKTREQFYQEELQKKENELISKGISLEDIKKVKEQTEKESIVKDHVSTLEDISEGVGKFNDGFVGNDIVSQIVSGISEGASYGVMINNLITIESYNIVADAINNQLEGLEKRHEKAETVFKEQHDKISDLEGLLTSTSSRDKSNEMNRSEALNWASNTDRLMNRVKGRSDDDYYGAFPDINKNEIIGREHITTIKCRL